MLDFQQQNRPVTLPLTEPTMSNRVRIYWYWSIAQYLVLGDIFIRCHTQYRYRYWDTDANVHGHFNSHSMGWALQASAGHMYICWKRNTVLHCTCIGQVLGISIRTTQYYWVWDSLLGIILTETRGSRIAIENRTQVLKSNEDTWHRGYLSVSPFNIVRWAVLLNTKYLI